MSSERPTPTAATLEVFIDRQRADCQRFGRLIARLGRRSRIQVSSFRHESLYQQRGISLEAAERRVHVYCRSTGRTEAGPAALRAIFRAIPVLWPLLLPLRVLALLGLADPVYGLLARARRIAPDGGGGSGGACPGAGSRGDRRRRMQRLGLAAAGGLFGLALLVHFLATFIHIMPLSSMGVTHGQKVSRYMNPLFTQTWTLFAPEPPIDDSRLNVQCRGKDPGQETPWLDTSSEMARNHARWRLTPAGYLLRVNRAAISGTLGIKSDVLEEMGKTIQEASPEQQQRYKAALHARALHRLEERRFLYRLLEHYCAAHVSWPVAAVRGRVLLADIPKFSKRHEAAPNRIEREIVFDWVGRGQIDAVVRSERQDLDREFEALDVTKMKPGTPI